MSSLAVDYDEEPRWEYIPNPGAQSSAHDFYVDELFYGGALGGGKTDYLIGEMISTLLDDRVSDAGGANGVAFRRTFPELNQPSGIIERLRERIPPAIGKYNEAKHRWNFFNGSVLQLGHLAADRDVDKYMGAEYFIVGFDQLEQFSEWQYLQIRTRLRISGQLKIIAAQHGLKPRSIATGQPGGIGHSWLLRRFIEPAPPRVAWRPNPTPEEPRPGTRVFIPATVDDTPQLDEAYRERLEALPDEDRRALRHGDWTVFRGQRFKHFRREIHVIDPEDFPISLGGTVRGLAIDYGLDHPFSAHWGAMFPGMDNLVVIYREIVKAGLTPDQQARLILASELPGERGAGRPLPTWIDPSTFNRGPDSGIPPKHMNPNAPIKGSVAARFAAAGLNVRKANNNRLLGVAEMSEALRVRPDGRPRLLIYSNCTELIATLPALLRDPMRPEDVLKVDGDDPYDSARYLLLGLLGKASRGPTRSGRDVKRASTRGVTGDLRRMPS